MGTTAEGAMQALVDRYIALFEDHAARLGPIRRFYAYQSDELQALQWEIQEWDPSEETLSDALVRLYNRWLEEMTPEERRELFAYNRQQRGEWRSHLLEEELEPRYASRNSSG